MDLINPDSLSLLPANLEPSLQNASGRYFSQFFNVLDNFNVDKDSKLLENLVFNKTVGLEIRGQKSRLKTRNRFLY